MSKIDDVLTAVAKMQTWQETTHERIFGGQQPGVLQYLHTADEKLAFQLAENNKELVAALTAFKETVRVEFTGVKADIAELKTEKKIHKAYMAGGVAAGSALGWLLKAGLLKLGVHLQ